MEISQYIKNLLQTNERVILGNFGAFTTKQISANIDKETKVMKPPFKIVIFDQNITEEAGLLIKYMAEQKQISIDNAKEQTVEYVKTIKSKLEAGKVVEFEGLGTFKKSGSDKIEFSYLSEDNLLLDSFGLPSVSISNQNKLKSPPDERKQPIKKGPTTKPDLKEKSKEQAIKKTPPVKKSPPVKKEKPVKKPPKVKTRKPAKTKPVSDKPKKKRKWLAIVIPIAAIGIMLAAIYFFKPDLWDKGYSFSESKLSTAKVWVTGLFNKNKSDKYDIIPDVVPEEDTQTVVTENIIDTNIIEDTTEEVIADLNETETIENNESPENNEEVVVDVTVNENPSSGQNGRYYIIVSSVVSQPAAQNEQKRFTRKGVSTSIIHVPKKGRYRLSIGDFGSAKEAQDYFSNFRSKHENIDAWVWEKK